MAGKTRDLGGGKWNFFRASSTYLFLRNIHFLLWSSLSPPKTPKSFTPLASPASQILKWGAMTPPAPRGAAHVPVEWGRFGALRRGFLCPPPYSSLCPWGLFGALRGGGEPSHPYPPSPPWGPFRALLHIGANRWCLFVQVHVRTCINQYVKSIRQPSVKHLPGRNLYRRQREKSLAARNPARNIATSEFLAVGDKKCRRSENTSDNIVAIYRWKYRWKYRSSVTGFRPLGHHASSFRLVIFYVVVCLLLDIDCCRWLQVRRVQVVPPEHQDPLVAPD